MKELSNIMNNMNVSIAIPVLVGLLAGWLVNYLADVLPATRKFSRPLCRDCDHPFSLWHYLLQRRCPSCGKQPEIRTWVVIAWTLLSSILIWLYPPQKLGFFLGFLLLTYFSLVFVIDLEHRLIMHPVSIVGGFLGLIVGILLQDLPTALLGGLGGFTIMLVIYLIGILFTRLRARRMKAAGMEPDDEEALGAGDVILAAVLGLMLGWPLIWFGLLVGILLGGFVSLLMVLGMLVIRRYKKDAWMVFIPYGPFLLISAALIIYLPNLLSVLVPK